MALVVTNTGETYLVDWGLKINDNQPNLILRLYSNDYTPVATSDSSDFIEATFTGYAASTLSRPNWADSTTDASGRAEAVYGTAQTFDSSDATAETLYGYYIETTDSSSYPGVVWAERFSNSITLNNGDSIQITPKLTGRSEN